MFRQGEAAHAAAAHCENNEGQDRGSQPRATDRSAEQGRQHDGEQRAGHKRDPDAETHHRLLKRALHDLDATRWTAHVKAHRLRN